MKNCSIFVSARRRVQLFKITLIMPPCIIAMLLMSFLQAPTAYSSSLAPLSVRPGQGIRPGQLFTGGKDHRKQAPTFLRRKNIHAHAALPAQASLSFSPAQDVSEPPYIGIDAAGGGYTDGYFLNECGPGASTATIGYWGVNLNRGTQSYSDPHAVTTWDDINHASYVQYIATQSFPPAFTSPGEMTYQTYPNAFTSFNDARDVLNWEASGHGSNYFNYFYIVVEVSNLTEASFKNDVQQDISLSRRPLLVSVNDSYLPDWINAPRTSHFITILGYDFNNNTITYSETCGKTSCNTQGTGIYTMNIDQLWSGMVDDNGNGGVIW